MLVLVLVLVLVLEKWGWAWHITGVLRLLRIAPGSGLKVLTRPDQQTADGFIEEVREMPEVLECQVMAGDCDFLLRVVASDWEAYRRFQAEDRARVKAKKICDWGHVLYF